MKTMNKRLLCIFAVFCLLTLCGCSLAVKDAGKPGPDKFIGYYITENSISGTIAAECVADSAADYGAITYVFPVEGYRFFTALVPAAENIDEYWISAVDSVFSEVNLSYGDTIALKGALYMDTDLPGFVQYFNQVYQRADGSVYMIPGEGFYVSSGSGGSTVSYHETVTSNESGKDITFVTSVEVAILPWERIDSYQVFFMSKENEVIRQVTYSGGMDSYDVSVPEKCEWIFITGSNTTGTVLRDAVTLTDSAAAYDFYFPGENHYARGYSVNFRH